MAVQTNITSLLAEVCRDLLQIYFPSSEFLAPRGPPFPCTNKISITMTSYKQLC